MMDIDGIKLKRLPNSLYLQYLKDCLHIFQIHNPGGAGIQELRDDLQAAAEDVEAIFGLDRASKRTAAIGQLDRLRGERLIGFSYLIKGNLKHFEADKVQAAKRLYTRLSVYGTASSINRETLQGQSNTLEHLIDGLQSEPLLAAALTTLGLETWVAEMKRLNDELITAYRQRVSEKSDFPKDKIIDLRLVSNDLYYQLRDKLLAHALIVGYAPPYDTVIRDMNVLIAKYNLTLERTAGLDTPTEEEGEEGSVMG